MSSAAPPKKKRCCHRVSLEKINNLINSQGDRISIELLFLFNVLVNRSITINGFCFFWGGAFLLQFCVPKNLVVQTQQWHHLILNACQAISDDMRHTSANKLGGNAQLKIPPICCGHNSLETTLQAIKTRSFNRFLSVETNWCKYLSIYSCYFSGSFQTLKYSTTFSLSETCASAIQTKPRCHQYRWHKRPRATYVVAPWHCASPPQWLLQSLKAVMLW